VTGIAPVQGKRVLPKRRMEVYDENARHRTRVIRGSYDKLEVKRLISRIWFLVSRVAGVSNAACGKDVRGTRRCQSRREGQVKPLVLDRLTMMEGFSRGPSPGGGLELRSYNPGGEVVTPGAKSDSPSFTRAATKRAG